ncbi:uncharacterized protein KY384_005616 [Bacidia gigantensis]|uniref:uncharacterized protein n=1 Tax=Bacidia gigantensis TaxID=2732470 RepID=UPI001D050129|nr:uncharacterized protein KY384_005616 [Bacidia gigantensis]KAG8530133.1 hypothetical protein KY384_005616 [Bacidia gigantensis]
MNTPMSLRMPHVFSGPEAFSTRDVKAHTFKMHHDVHFEYFPDVAPPADVNGACACEGCGAEPTTPFAVQASAPQADHWPVTGTPFSLDVLVRPAAQTLSRDATLSQLSKATKKLSELPKPSSTKMKSKWQCGSATFDKVVLTVEPNFRAATSPSPPDHSDKESPMLEWKDLVPIFGDRGLGGYLRDAAPHQLLEIQFAVMREDFAQPIAFGKVKRGKLRGGSGDYSGEVNGPRTPGVPRTPGAGDGLLWADLSDRVGRDFRPR